ncbi:MAG TPA: metallophosphoesterase family protein, partial [Solirubrobacterales bacterium]
RRFLLVHGTPRDPLDEYVMKDEAAWAQRVRDAEADIVCVGHSHMQFNLVADGVVILNPGSVGQPRDGDPRAAWLELDTEAWTARWHRVEYDIEGAAAAIRAAGLPGVLAERLEVGR